MLFTPSAFRAGAILQLMAYGIPFPRSAMAANLVHCGMESGPKQNNGCKGYCEKKNSMT